MKKLQEVYNEWRKNGENSEIPFTWDCGELSARVDFSSYADLEDLISFDEMLELENNY